MHSPSAQHKADWLEVQGFLAGERQVVARLMERHSAVLRRGLKRRGATEAEAEDLVAGLWSDCLGTEVSRGSLLEKYQGRVALRSWLMTIVTRRLIDLKRRQRQPVTTDGSSESEQESAYALLERMPAAADPVREEALVDLLRSSLMEALGRCETEVLFMLRLVYVHGLTQRELGRMWGCHEAQISRTLRRAMDQIRDETLRQVESSDPWLRLTWQDFLDLCQTEGLDFWG